MVFFSSMGGSAWGGSEVLWSRAAWRALEAGHRVTVSVFDHGAEAPEVASLARAGAAVVGRERRPSRVASWFGTPGWLRSFEGVDAVCVSQGAAFEAAGRRATRPMVRWLTRSGVPFVNVVQFNRPGASLGWAVRGLAGAFYRGASRNLFVAGRNIGEASAVLGFEVPRAGVIRNPVNLTDVSALPWPAEDGVARLACVGRLHVAAKGQDLLLEAFSRRAWRDGVWRLTLAGSGEDRAALTDQASRLGLAGNIEFAGEVADVRSLWAGHHLLVLPSRAEGTPLAMVEAMLMGRAGVVSDVGGCAEWVSEGESGFVAASAGGVSGGPPDVGTVGAALDRAWAARGAWREMGERARRAALGLYDPDPGSTLLRHLEDAARRGRIGESG